MRFRLLVLLVLMALFLVPLAGCGGSGDDSDNASATADAQSVDAEDEAAQATEPEADAAVSDDENSEAQTDQSEDAADIASLDSLDSYRQTMTTRSVSGDEVTEWTILTEFVREPRAMRMLWTSVDDNGDLLDTWETIQIGTTTYMRGDEAEDGTAQWISYSSDEAEEPLGVADVTNWMNASNFLDDPNCKRQGREDVDGQPTVLYTCDMGVFGAYGGIWGVTGQLTEASVQSWVSDEYQVPLRTITKWVGKDDDDVPYEYYSEGTITDINQPITIEAPEGVDAPGLPEDVPLYPEATVTLAMTGMVGFEVEAEMADVLAFYKAEMEANGWTLESEFGEMLSYTMDERSVTIMLSADESLISGSIIVQ